MIGGVCMKYVWTVIGIIFMSWSIILLALITSSSHVRFNDIESLVLLLSLGVAIFSLSIGHLYKRTSIVQEEIDDLRVRIKERNI